MTIKTFCTLAAAIFALIALLQLIRIAMGWSITLNGIDVPLWASWIAVMVAGALSFVVLFVYATIVSEIEAAERACRLGGNHAAESGIRRIARTVQPRKEAAFRRLEVGRASKPAAGVVRGPSHGRQRGWNRRR